MAMSFVRPDPSSPSSVADAAFGTSRRGFDQDISGAYWGSEEYVPVVYKRSNPDWAYRDDLISVWMWPLGAGFFHILFLIFSFKEPRGQRYW